jgi:hypothetical protein
MIFMKFFAQRRRLTGDRDGAVSASARDGRLGFWNTVARRLKLPQK